MPAFDASSYFAARAPRYQEALRVCPSARVLDYLPYLAAFAAGGVESLDGSRACDAFGGTGFLSRVFSRLGMRLVVADICPEMLAGAAGIPNVEIHVTHDDFRSTLDCYGDRSFDLVFSHGGLHHVVEAGAASVDTEGSRLRQRAVVLRLARLLRPGGILLLADIPPDTPQVRPGVLVGQGFDARVVTSCCSADSGVLRSIPWVESNVLTLDLVQEQVEAHLWKPVAFNVPRFFFDEFISIQAPMGHVAVYPDFDDLDESLCAKGLRLLGRVNYKGPWLFSDHLSAGWFFREKFSLNEASAPGYDPETEGCVYQALEEFLGSSAGQQWIAVNWGVTYAAYKAS